MGANDKSFTNRRISRLLLKFAVPAVFSLLVGEIYNMVGTVFAGRYIGANAIGALTVAFPIQRFFIALAALISIGTSTYASRVIGEKNVSELKKIIINSFILTLGSLIIISILISIFQNPILHMLGASNSTYPMANRYMTIAMIGGIFQALSTVFCYTMISLGQTRMIVYTNLIGVSLNILVHYVLIVKVGMGIEGSAIAGVVAQVASFIFASLMFFKESKSIKIKFTGESFSKALDADTMKEIIIGGFSTFIVEISDAVVSAVLNNLLYSNGGDSAIIVFGIITKISMFLYITMTGISSGMQPIIGYNFGAENYKKVKETLKISLKAVIGLSFVFWIAFMQFAQPIIGFFLKDKTLLSETVKDFRICISMIPLLGIYYVIMYYYQAIGESKKSFLLSIYREMVIFIPLAILLTKIFGSTGVIIAYPITDTIVVLTSAYFIKKAFNEKLDEEEEDSTDGKIFSGMKVKQSED